MLYYLLVTIHVLISIFLILVVLLQRGKGADLSVFGGGSTQAAFGARGTASLLHKLTVASFVLFVVTTLSIALVQGRAHRDTVLKDVETAKDTPADAAAPAAETTPATDAEQLTPAPTEPSAVPVESAPAESVPAESTGQTP